MSEIIYLQIGQCGNQIGWKFWEKALNEHRSYHGSPGVKELDTSYQSFFEVAEKGSFSRIKDVRARGILIDSESNVTDQIQKSEIGSLFAGRTVSVDVGGAGNNWARGYHENGPKQIESVLEMIRKLAEPCHHLGSFFMLYSLGGGTGSGFGSYILENVADLYPKIWKMATVVTPTGESTDVVTAPLNSILSASHLHQFADCVFPVENDALARFVVGEEDKYSKGAFDQMNSVVANFLLDLTAGSRFSGKLNVDLSEIQTNLVPFPHHKYVVSGISPLNLKNPPRNETGYLSEAMSPKATLCNIDPTRGTYLSSALLLRGDIQQSSIQRFTASEAERMNFPLWNSEHFKVGHCARPPLSSKISVCALNNTSAISSMFDTIIERFWRLYKSGAYIHQFFEWGVDQEDFKTADEFMKFVRDEYLSVEEPMEIPPRERVII